MSEDQATPDPLTDFEKDIGKRHLVITVDQNSGDIECEWGSFAAWELVGVAAWLDMLGHEEMMRDTQPSEDEEE
jgi:hypothetical protein